jgi:hypothetical protein
MLNSLLKLCKVLLDSLLLAGSAFAQDLKRDNLVYEALRNNPESQAFGARIDGARQRVPQITVKEALMILFVECIRAKGVFTIH